MAGSNSFGQLLIVNGQPILLKEGLHSSQQFAASDFFQPSINNVTDSASLPPIISCHTNNESNSLRSDLILSVVESPDNQYITELSVNHNNMNSSSMRLTADQAAELGLQLIDNMDETLQPNVLKKQINKDLSVHNDIKSSTSVTHSLDNSEDVKIVEYNLVCNDNGKNKTSENGVLESYQSVSNTSNQEYTLVPHLVNGTVTYSLHLTNQEIEQSSDGELLRITNSAVMSQDSPTPNHTLRYDLSSLSSSPELPFIDSVEVESNNLTETSVTNINENETLRDMSCDTENIAFLGLADGVLLEASCNDAIIPLNKNNALLPKSTRIKFNNSNNKSSVHIKRESLLLKRTASSLKIESRPKTNVNSIQKLGFRSDSYSSTDRNISNKIHDSSIDVDNEVSKSNNCFVDELSSSETTDHITMNEHMLNQINKQNCCNVQNDNIANLPTIITPDGGDFPKEVSIALNRIPIKTNCNKPLGSNENPIKLVQQGSTFHSMQALTEDHISKIKPILHEKFDSTSTSKNVLYDPTSNTRIIYRIISPSEVHLRKQNDCSRRRGRPKKVNLLERQEEEMDGAPPPKKLFPRTRSGRLSRPPKHMVRDYKHIRRADADNSDGGFSDYHSENEEDAAQLIDTAPVELLPGLVSNRKSNKRNISAENLCPTCGKIYLGFERMKRHFDKYPEHGSIAYLNNLRNTNPDSEAENHRAESGNGLWKKGSGGRRSKSKNGCLSSADKRARLKEAVDWCEAQEVVNIAGPTVTGILSLWELLLLRVDNVKRNSRVATLYDELCQLFTILRCKAHKLFRPLDHPLLPGTKHITVQVEDELMSQLLNLPCGVYLASDEDLDKPSSNNLSERNYEEPQLQNLPHDVFMTSDRGLDKHPSNNTPEKNSEETQLQNLSCSVFLTSDEDFDKSPSNKSIEPSVKHTHMLNLPCNVYLPSDEDMDKPVSSNISEATIPKIQMPVVKNIRQEMKTEEPKVKIIIDDVQQPFLEEMICDTGLNVDEIVSERLQKFTGSQSSTVDELITGLNELEQRSDDLMEGFSIVSHRDHVSASTEDLMKSLEHFESDLTHSDAPDRDTFDRVTNVDTLDFEVLSREFHSNNR